MQVLSDGLENWMFLKPDILKFGMEKWLSFYIGGLNICADAWDILVLSLD